MKMRFIFKFLIVYFILPNIILPNSLFAEEIYTVYKEAYCDNATFDLYTLYQEAYCNDTLLQAAKETQLSVREAIPEARSQLLPVLSGQGILLNNHSTLDTIGNFNTQTLTVSLTQPVIHFDYWQRYSQAIDIVKQANALYASQEQDLMTRLAHAYFGVLQAQDNLQFAKESVKAYAKFRTQTEERYKEGLIAITDFEIAKAQHDSAVAVEVVRANELFNQKERLRQIIGRGIPKILPLRKDIPLVPPEPLDVEQWVTIALIQNLSLQAARFGTQASKANIQINSYKHLPTIDIVGQVQRATPFVILPGPKATDSNIGIMINVPIFQGGAISSRTRRAIHEYLKTDRETESLHRSIESVARQAFQGILSHISEIHALRQAMVSNQSALEATHASFSVGTRTIVDVLNAQRALIQAQQHYAESRYRYILEIINLKQAAGTLCEEDLMHINGWLKTQVKELDSKVDNK